MSENNILKIVAVGDTDVTNDSDAVLGAISMENADCFIFAGDGPYSTTGTKWINLIDKHNLKNIIKLTQGNHEHEESESQQTEKDIEEWMPSLKEVPEDGGDQSWEKTKWIHSWQLGNAFFISMNTQDKDRAFTRNQYNWVKKQLNQAKQLEQEGKIDWIFVVFHKPFYTLKTKHGPEVDTRRIFQPLFDDAQVDICISGHIHCYQVWYPLVFDPALEANGSGRKQVELLNGSFDFSKKHGQIYVVNGSGGHEIDALKEDWQNNEKVMYADDQVFGYSLFEISGKKCKILFKNNGGKIIGQEINITKDGAVLATESHVSATPISLDDQNPSVTLDESPPVSLDDDTTPSFGGDKNADDECACFYRVEPTKSDTPISLDDQIPAVTLDDHITPISLDDDTTLGFEGGIDKDTGVRMLHKTTGNYVEMQVGGDPADNGQRYNVNHKYINYMMIGYFHTGKSQELIEMKVDGPNHGSCKSLPRCCWTEPAIELEVGKAHISSEWPHPENRPAADAQSAIILNQNLKNKWIGYAVVAYQSGQFRTIEQWCDPTGLNSADQPNNNWILTLKETDTGQITNQDLAIRPLPIEGKGLEAEIRMHGDNIGHGKPNGTDMKFCRVYEIVNPT